MNTFILSPKRSIPAILSAWMLTGLLFLPACAQSVVRSGGSHSESSGFDLSAVDSTLSPCEDFYRYACGNWMKSHSIPPDQAWWGRFSDFFSGNETLLREIMENAARKASDRTRAEQLVGDYYNACTNEAEIDRRGSAPLRAELRSIASLQSKPDLTRELARLHALGLPALFNMRSRRDPADSSMIIAEVDRGGLTLPNRDYYLRNDAEMSEIRKKYLDHLARMFQLAGDTETEAEAEARAVLEVESTMATAALDLSARRNPDNLKHIAGMEELSRLAPAILWPKYFHDMGIPPVNRLNIAEPVYLKALDALLAQGPSSNVRSYLRWQVIDFFVPALSESFAIQDFNFRGKVLGGRNAILARWKRCVELVNDQLGEAVGQIYVAKTLHSGGKAQVLKIVEAEEAAMAADINSLTWMSPETKRNALTKLNTIVKRIGYPDQWQDYSSLQIHHGNLLQSYADASRFVTRHRLEKIGKPASDREWSMTPQTIDASYNPQENTMNFPAGILRPPFYDNEADEAVNFGAIGVVIGHELTHGFDDEGRKFDLHGNLHDWWTVADSKQFEERSQCFVNEYNDVEVLPGLKANGKLTVGENIADNGGVRIAYTAWMNTMKQANPEVPERVGKDGFTPTQRFFLTYAQLWCQNMSEGYMRQRTLNNEHSLGPWRVNGVVQNMPEFAAAFSCSRRDKMVRQNACSIW
ncbi:MAG TPA: M13 family metallopeptidase [Candidatus Angelobacter sp.]|jgi:predicted metalloendopeptidase